MSAAGDPAAQAMLGGLLYDGSGLDRDRERALRLVRAAAEAGIPEAMRTLGRAYRSGNGLLKDPAQALRWWRRCAELGNGFCMTWYGIELIEGELTTRDLETGMAWLLRAAEAGNRWAIYDLGNLYDEGWYGLPRDEAKALHWKRKLAIRGEYEARGWLLYYGYSSE